MHNLFTFLPIDFPNSSVSSQILCNLICEQMNNVAKLMQKCFVSSG